MKKLLLTLSLVLTCNFTQAQVTPTNVEDLSTYTGSDPLVYNLADGKVYAYNNLNQYEEYGIYEKTDGLALKTASATDVQAAYIYQNTNGVYFDTNYTPKANTRIVCTANIDANAYQDHNWHALFGCGDGSADGRISVCFHTNHVNGEKNHMSIYTNNAASQNHLAIYGIKAKYEFDAATGNVKTYDANGYQLTPTINFNANGTGKDCTTTLYLFGEKKANGGLTNPFKGGRFYEMEIYEGNTLVRHYLPWVNAEGVAGIKETTTGTFIAPTGGTVTASVPGVTAYEGKIVRLTTDQHIYKYTSGNWVDQGEATKTEIDDTTYKKMRDWTNMGAMANARNNGDFSDDTENNITYKGIAGGDEGLKTAVALDEGEDYNYSFSFTTIDSYSWYRSAYPFQVWLSDKDITATNSPYDPAVGIPQLLGQNYLPHVAVTGYPVSIDFTAASTTTIFFAFSKLQDNVETPMTFANQRIVKYGYPIAYASPYHAPLGTAIATASSLANTTTEAVWNALLSRIAEAQAVYDNAAATFTEERNALNNLNAACNACTALDVTILRQIITLAQAEGIDTSDGTDFLANGTEATERDNLIGRYRQARKLHYLDRDTRDYAGNAPAEAQYYLYNVGQQAYLTNGGRYGTHAVVGYPGLLATLAAFNGGYSIQFAGELVDGQARNAYLDDQGWCDGATGYAPSKLTFTFEAVEGQEGIYNLRNGYGQYVTFTGSATDQNQYNTIGLTADAGIKSDPNAQWKLVTKEQRLATLDEATAENPVDATIAMKNAGFSKHANVEGAWNNLTQTWDTNSEAYGDWVAGCFNVQDYDLFQDVTFPKAGVYEVSVQAYYRSGSDTAYEAVWNTPTALHETPLLYAGDVTASIAYLADDADKAPGEGKNYVFGNAPSYVTQDRLFFESGCYRNTVRVSIPADGTTLRVGIKKEGTDWPAQDWFAADNFRLVYYGPEEKTVTLTNGYATFSASSNYAIVGSDVKAYKATEKNGNYIHMEELTDGIPANTGVMLYGAGQTTVTLKPAENATSDVSDNLLKPNVTATAIPAEADGYKNYLLVKSDDKVVFAPSNGNGMLAAGRAYLQLLAGNDAKYFITFGDETGIEMVNSLTPDPSPMGEGSKYVYDLQGRKVAFHSPSGNSSNSWFHSPSKKGVYIVDGKKIVK